MPNPSPFAPTPTFPPNNAYVLAGQPIVFEWVFNDPGDAQTSADLKYRRSDDPPGTWTTIFPAATTEPTYTLPEDTLAPGFQFEWAVATVSSNGHVSQLSVARFSTRSTPFPRLS